MFERVIKRIKHKYRGSGSKIKKQGLDQKQAPVKEKSITEIPPESGLCLLLSLPLEIRLMIYEELLVTQRPGREFEYWIPSWQKYAFSWGIHTNILSVCRQINDEAREITYTHHTFKFTRPYLCNAFVSLVHPELYKLIRSIHISYGDSCNLQPTELARDWVAWLNSLVGFPNLNSATFDVDYSVVLPSHVARSWQEDPERLGKYDNWEVNLLECIGKRYAEWHKGIKLESCLISYAKDKRGEGFAYKRATFHWISAGEEGKKQQAERWKNIDILQKTDWSPEIKDWHYFIYRRLPPVDEREIMSCKWPIYVLDTPLVI
jgi:hypothetical protein